MKKVAHLWRRWCLLLAVFVFAVPSISQDAGKSPVDSRHLRAIGAQLARHQLPGAQVALDTYGRVVLRGTYQDREEVEKAHSIVQSVVGVSWTSFVTPENIRVSDLEKTSHAALNDLFARVPGTANPRQPGAAPRPTSGNDVAPGPINQKFALVVGVGTFREPRVQPLKFAAKDAAVFHEFLLDPQGGAFRPDQVTLLENESATAERVKAWLTLVEN